MIFLRSSYIMAESVTTKLDKTSRDKKRPLCHIKLLLAGDGKNDRYIGFGKKLRERPVLWDFTAMERILKAGWNDRFLAAGRAIGIDPCRFLSIMLFSCESDYGNMITVV